MWVYWSVLECAVHACGACESLRRHTVVLWAVGLVGVRCAVRVQTKGATPLFVASEHGCIEAVRMLLDVGGAVNQAMVREVSATFYMWICVFLGDGSATCVSAV
jgi:hypothetical protein